MNMTVPRPRPRMFHTFCSAMSSLTRWHNGRDIKNLTEIVVKCLLYAFRPALVIANFRRGYKYRERAKTPLFEAERGRR